MVSMAMNDLRSEQLSALMDDELGSYSAGDLLYHLGRDPELRATWERYHLIAHALRGEAINPSARRLAESVGDVIRAEPVPLRGRAGAAPVTSRLAPFGGAALAAAAAFLAVFAVPNLFQGSDPANPEILDPQAATWTSAADLAESRWDVDRPDLASKLDVFLVNHQEAAPATGVKGMLPYATLVGYDPAR
jgi:sigma-E factor negative regulatory protein RseA